MENNNFYTLERLEAILNKREPFGRVEGQDAREACALFPLSVLRESASLFAANLFLSKRANYFQNVMPPADFFNIELPAVIRRAALARLGIDGKATPQESSKKTADWIFRHARAEFFEMLNALSRDDLGNDCRLIFSPRTVARLAHCYNVTTPPSPVPDPDYVLWRGDVLTLVNRFARVYAEDVVLEIQASDDPAQLFSAPLHFNFNHKQQPTPQASRAAPAPTVTPGGGETLRADVVRLYMRLRERDPAAAHRLARGRFVKSIPAHELPALLASLRSALR